MAIWAGSGHAQINTTAGTVTSCPGDTVVSINVTNCNGVGAISLVLNFDNAKLTYVDFLDLNAALSGGLLIVNSTGNKVVFSWARTTVANIGNGTLFKLKFTAIPGTSSLIWDTQTSGNCEYSDVNGNVLPSTYTNGSVIINQPPLINTQPIDKTVLVGSNTSFTVSAGGTGLSYLWRCSTNGGIAWTDLTNTPPYSGVTTATLGITNAQLTYNGYKYACRVRGTCSPEIITDPATLTVINPITTTLPTASFCPGNIVVPVGVTNFTGVGAFSLSFTYNASCLTYTGYQNLNGALGLSGSIFVANASGGKVFMTWSYAPGATFGNGTLIELLFTAAPGTSPLAWDLANEGSCEYTLQNGSEFNSVFVNGSETIYSLPAVTVNPTNKVIAKGQNTSFSVSATGSGLAYLWTVSTDGGINFSDLSNGGYYSNVTTSTMNITGAQLALTGYQYLCKVSGTCLPVVYSNPAILTVLPNVITTCGTATGCPGQIIIPVNVTDFIGVSSFSLVLNFNSSVLTYAGYMNLNAAVSGGMFNANASGGKVFLTWSNIVPATIGNGGTLFELKFDGTSGTSALTWDTQTIGNCEYTDFSGQVIFSTWNNGNATINSPPVITVQPVNKTIYATGSASFSVTATGTGLMYRWQVSANGGAAWSNLTNVSPYSGVSTPTLTINPASTELNGYLYHCVVTGTCSQSLANSLTLQNITIGSGQTSCYNATQTIAVAGSGTAFVVQNGGSASMIAGQKISFLVGTKVYSGGYLHGSITNAGQYCSILPPQSEAAQLTVTQAPITTTAGSVSGSCSGSMSIPVSVTNCNNVGGISLTLIFDTTKLTFQGYQSVNAALTGGLLAVNHSANKVFMTWASAIPVTIGSGVLIQYRFNGGAGISTTLTWDTQTTGACEYSDASGVIITSFYNNSAISIPSTALIVDAGPDMIKTGSSVQLSGSAIGGTAPYTWLWSPAGSLNNPAIQNPVASPTVTTTYTLTVTANNGCVGSDMMEVVVAAVPADLTLQGINIPGGTSNCYNALQTITVAGSNTTFIVQVGGSAIMIAGQKIRYLTGTKVFPGGYLHGYITTSAQYCNTLAAPLVATATEETQAEPPGQAMFRIYPNPTTGRFTLELTDNSLSGNVYVTVYGMYGEKILSGEMLGKSLREFSLAGKPAGVYFVRVVNGNRGDTRKLLKE